MLQSCFDNLDIPLTEIYCKCVLVSSWNLSVLKRSWYSCETCPMNSQPDLHYRSSSRRCSMMSSQITVCSLWIVSLSVACCSLKWVDVWRWLHFIGLFLPSSTLLPTLLPTLSLFLSLPLTFLYSGLLQSGGIMEAGCVVAAVIENAASGPQGEPGSGDVLERWVSVFFDTSCQPTRIM